MMEQGVEPIARMIWAPSNPVKPDVDQVPDPVSDLDRSPLREPPITADPLVLLEPPASLELEAEPTDQGLGDDGVEFFAPQVPLPPDLPPPVLLDMPSLDAPPLPELESGLGRDDVLDEEIVLDQSDGVEEAPPPPELPPLNPPPLPVDRFNQ